MPSLINAPPPWAYDCSNRNELDPNLKAAQYEALREYIDANNDNNANVRICDANSLCRYWSEDDMNKAELTEPILYRQLLNEEQINEILTEASIPGVWPRGIVGGVSRTEPVPTTILTPPLCCRHRFASSIVDDVVVVEPLSLSLSPSSPSASLAELSTDLRSVAHHEAYTDEHVVLYMHMDDWFTRTHPILWSRIRRGMEESRRQQDDGVGNNDTHNDMSALDDELWIETNRSKLNVRCIELHHYVEGGGLITPGHRDNGSEITISILLSDPATVSGGDFVTYCEGMAIAHKMNRGDAIIFDSEKLHNISTVTKGLRQSLVVELWPSSRNKRNRFS